MDIAKVCSEKGNWEREAAAFEILDKVVKELQKSSKAHIYLDTKNRARLCSEKENVTEEQLWNTAAGKKLKEIDQEILAEFLRVQRIRGRFRVYEPFGYITYFCSLAPDYKNGIYDKDNVGTLFLDVPNQADCCHNRLELTISPDVTRAQTIDTLKAIIQDIEQNPDNFEKAKESIQKKADDFDIPTNTQRVVARFLEKGVSLMKLKKRFGKKFVIFGGRCGWGM